jgi:RND superfamily putative drug exporter
MNRIFALIGVASVRFRYLIVVAWIAITIVPCGRCRPWAVSPRHDERIPAGQRAEHPGVEHGAPFVDVNLGTATLVAVRDGGLTRRGQRRHRRLETKIKGIDTVKVVVDLGISGDGAARQVLIEAAGRVVHRASAEPSTLVTAIRSAATAAAPAGLQVHLTGEIPDQVDNANASGSSQDRTQTFSLLFILVLLVLAYRALLAPFLTLIPAVIVLTLSGPVIAQAASAGSRSPRSRSSC